MSLAVQRVQSATAAPAAVTAGAPKAPGVARSDAAPAARPVGPGAVLEAAPRPASPAVTAAVPTLRAIAVPSAVGALTPPRALSLQGSLQGSVQSLVAASNVSSVLHRASMDILKNIAPSRG